MGTIQSRVNHIAQVKHQLDRALPVFEDYCEEHGLKADKPFAVKMSEEGILAVIVTTLGFEHELQQHGKALTQSLDPGADSLIRFIFIPKKVSL